MRNKIGHGNRSLIFIALMASLFNGCAKRYELGTVEPRPFQVETLISKQATLFIEGGQIKDRYEDFNLGLDLRGVHILANRFFTKKMTPHFKSFVVADQNQGTTAENDILLYPALSIVPTDDGALAKDLVMKFSLKAQNQAGRLLCERNMEKRFHYATTTKAEIETGLGELFDEVSEEVLRDLSKVK